LRLQVPILMGYSLYESDGMVIFPIALVSGGSNSGRLLDRR